jgi:hypothetical protein
MDSVIDRIAELAGVLDTDSKVARCPNRVPRRDVGTSAA